MMNGSLFVKMKEFSHGISFDMYCVLAAETMVNESAGRILLKAFLLLASSAFCPSYRSIPDD